MRVWVERWGALLFFAALAIVFLLVPWSFTDKLYGICFGI